MAELKSAGRYELQEELGRGAMGIVYKAYDPRIGRTVAVKTMRLTEAGTGMSHDELVNRFDIETRAAGRLTHPNIVVVYDAGEDGGLFYITMEFVQGRSLQALIDQKQVFPLPRIVRILEQAGSALDFAHQNSIVHRDVKPANLLLTADDTVKVSDFGTAKILQKGSTQTGAILGTPSYMSPEQVKGKPVDGRSDIFSFGVILYELVTGEKPFPGQNVTTVIYKIVNEEPIPPREIDNSVHPGLSYVIMRALSKDPDERYQNCKDVVEDLKNYKNLAVGSDSATVVMPGRNRPKEVEEAIARSKASIPAPAVATRPLTPPAERTLLEPPAQARPVAPRPVTLPSLTGSLTSPVVEEKPKGRAGQWVLTLLLLAAIGGAGYYMWPDIQRILNQGAPQVAQPPSSQPGTPPSAVPTESAPASGAADPAASPATAGKQPAKVEPSAASNAPTQNELNAREVQSRVEAAGLGRRVRADVAGRDVTLTGSVTAEEARRIRARFQRLPGRLRLVDRLQIAKAPLAANGAPADGSEKPKTAPGKGEVEVLTEPGGAAAVLSGAKSDTCHTPCRFEDLPPGRYTLQVTREGFRTINRILNIRAGNISQEMLTLEAVEAGLMISSTPPQADVLINGQLRGVTPVTLQLSPGRYNVTLRKSGFQDQTQPVQVEAEKLLSLTVPLQPTRSQGAQPAPSPQTPAGKGWIEVRTIPPGADILLNNASTGRKTPARLELAPGTYTLTIFARGYQVLQKQIQVEAEKTLTLNEALSRQ